MSTEEDRVEALILDFEEKLTSASTAGLFEFAEGINLVVPGGTKKSKLMADLRKFMFESWGETDIENLEYLTKCLEAFEVILQVPINVQQTTQKHSPINTNMDINPPKLQRNDNSEKIGDSPSHPQPSQTQQNTASSHVSFATNSVMTNATNTPYHHEQSTRSRTSPISSENPPDIARWFQCLEKDSEINPFRRQLKITGIIGDEKDGKNVLNYINLSSQIGDALKSGYTKDEIVRSIKRAVAAGSSLRTYFDTQTVSLEDMLSIIRDFYGEKSANDMFKDLGQLCQGAEEKATDFLIRAFHLRQKVLIASDIEGATYGTTLVFETFCRSVRTGLLNEATRGNMKKFLDPKLAPPTPDNVLLRELSAITIENDEALAKHKVLRKVNVRELEAKVNAEHAEQKKQSLSGLTDTLQPLVDGMALLQKQMQELKENKQGGQKRYRKCPDCQKSNNQTCRHCWKCGGSTHFSRECKTSGN